MKKQEMINTIMLEEKKLFNEYKDFLNVLGKEHEATMRAFVRWSTINELVKTLGL